MPSDQLNLSVHLDRLIRKANRNWSLIEEYRIQFKVTGSRVRIFDGFEDTTLDLAAAVAILRAHDLEDHDDDGEVTVRQWEELWNKLLSDESAQFGSCKKSR